MKTVGDRLTQLEETNQLLEQRVLELENKIGDWPTGPFKVPEEMPLPIDACQVCGIIQTGVMGYCCSRTDCPTYVGDTIFGPINSAG